MRLSNALLIHSQRQLKRARGHPRSWPPAAAEPVPAPRLQVQPLRPLPSGFVPPPPPPQPAAAAAAAAPPAPGAAAPFRVERTTAGRQLPVYTDYKNGRSRTLTLVRKVSGDVPFLVEELRRVTGGAAVAAKLGRVEIEGDRAKEVRAWLAGLGF